MVCIASLVAETDVGIHKTNVCLLLYQSLFLSTMLFNSQTWSNLRKNDLEQLRIIQSKFLKKIIGVPNSACSAFTYLELGVIPMEYEIHKRQIKYLQRILQLEGGDPVREVFMFQMHQRQNGIMENNWWSDVSELMVRYEIDCSLEEIRTMTKEQFKKLVNTKVENVAFLDLISQCKGKKKTQDLE